MTLPNGVLKKAASRPFARFFGLVGRRLQFFEYRRSIISLIALNPKIASMVPPAKIASLEQLDALVARYVMDDEPRIYWEHTDSQWRFDNLSDALDALHDPFFASLVPPARRSNLSVAEVREYPAYSADPVVALKIVERLGCDRRPLILQPFARRWAAAFGADERVEAPSPSMAICIAALRARGIEVELPRAMLSDTTAAA